MIAHETTRPDRQDAGGADPWADDVFVFPTSVGQQGFWYLDQFQPGNPAYNIAVRFRLQGWLRVEELERALNEIVRRHESLRTVFAVVDGVPVQVVSPRLSIRLQRDDLRGGPEKDRRQRAGAVAAEEARLPFDLTKGPLVRARLLRLDDEEHTLLVTIHHIVSDGWSIGVLTKELGALYDAYCRGLDSPLPELALQCGDFAVWQEQWLQSQDLNDQIDYWTRRLANLPLLEIPPDRPRGPVQTFKGDIESILLPRKLTDGLESLSNREKATPFMLMLAAFQLLLQRCTGRNDVFVGTVLAGRSRVELEPLIGLFINPLVLRTDLSGDPPFLELLSRVRETVLQAFANQDVPFERVVDAVQPKRDPSRHPVFQINFLYQRDFVHPFHAAGLTLTAIPSASPGAIYDLNFFLVERAEGWRASFEYNNDLYQLSTIRRLLGQFQSLLEGIAANPACRISELPLTTSAVEREILSLPAGQSAPPTVPAPSSAGLTPSSYVAPRNPVERGGGIMGAASRGKSDQRHGGLLRRGRPFASRGAAPRPGREGLPEETVARLPAAGPDDRSDGGPTSHAEIKGRVRPGAGEPRQWGKPSGGRVGRPGRAGLCDAARRLPTALASRRCGTVSPAARPPIGKRSARVRRGVAGAVGLAGAIHGEGHRRQPRRGGVCVRSGGPLSSRGLEPRRPDRL